MIGNRGLRFGWLERIPKRVRTWLVFGGILLFYATHFLELASVRVPLPDDEIRETEGLGARFHSRFTQGGRDQVINRFAHIEEDGWRARSIRARSAKPVQTMGRGRFFVTDGGNLWFSASDDTMPGQNGRSYVLVIPRKAPLWALWLPLAGLATLSWRRPVLFPRPALLIIGWTVALIALWNQGWELRQNNESFPMMDGDFTHYRTPAVRYKENGTISVYASRSFVYPLLCGIAMKQDGHGYEYVSHLQRLVSLAAAMSLAGAILLAARRLFGLPLLAGCVVSWLGAACYVLAPPVLLYETAFRPESLSMSVACFYLFLAVHALIAWIEGRSRLAGGLTMLVFIAGAALYVVRESWGFAIFAPAMLPLLFAHPWRARIAWAAVGLVALTLVFVPARAYQKYLERTTDPEMSAWFFPRYLMLWQADVIRPVLQSKVAEGRAEPFEQRLNEIYDLEFARAAEPGAEIDPDPKFGYSPGRISVMMNEHLETASLAERSRILNELYEAGVKQHPLHFLAKVLGQLEYYYGLGAKIYPTNIHPAKARLASAFTALGPSYEAEVKLFHTASEMSRLKDPRDLIEKHPPRQVRVMLDGMDAVFSWMIIAFVAWLAWNLARGRRGIFWDRPRRRIALATGWILFVPFCVVLTFASISTLTTERFISQLLPLTLFSQICLAFYLGLEIKAIWRNNARPEVESEAIPPHGL